ncbi:TROVE domain-containing protein [Mariniblastus fucicola]|nr:TROVE domain-containing protein [Mariniblastus fucicola]
MANRSLFESHRGNKAPVATFTNEAGGRAYQLDAQHQLAQFAATGCLNGTFYATAETQLDQILHLSETVDPEFLAQVAVYSRKSAFMKDMPALLLAVLSTKDGQRFEAIFDWVIDSPKMLRTFVQIMRSGVVGRKSLGSLPKRMIRNWIDARSDQQLFFGSVGQSPSLADVIKMVHPKPRDDRRAAMLGYLIGREVDSSKLPEVVHSFEKFKRTTDSKQRIVPDVPFQMLTSVDLQERDWKQIARNGSWQMTRMNLNTFLRHGVFKDGALVNMVANRLRDRSLIQKARVFPYQLMAAFMNVNDELPSQVRDALQDAMEIAIENVPKISGQVFVFPDVSGSMGSSVSGYRKGATSKVRCVDVAALVAAAMLRVNDRTVVMPFENSVANCKLNPRDSVMTNAKRLSGIWGGGTNCSAPLKELNRKKAKSDLVIYVSDNESWIDSRRGGRQATATMTQWEAFKARNPQAKMICIDIQPYGTSQTIERDDIIHVAGFSDQVFRLISSVASGEASKDFWVNQIKQTRVEV